MKIDIKTLDILFRKVPPGEVLKQLQSQTGKSDRSRSKKWFARYASSVLAGYSEDEYELIYERLQKDAEEWSWKKARQGVRMPEPGQITDQQLPALALLSVGKLSDDVLCLKGQVPHCKIEKTLFWREAFWLLGQDLFVCSFLAQEDILARRSRSNFVWPAMIRTDHAALNSILSKGLAENHQHLYGSSQTFALSWCDMMNYPEDHKRLEGLFEPFRQPVMLRGSSDLLVSIPDRVRYACYLRLYIFKDLKTSECGSKNLHCWLNQMWPEQNILRELQKTRLLYGARVPQPDRGVQYLDYALTKEVFCAAPDAEYRALASERAFLYECFRLFYQGQMDDTMLWAFYLYILLKAQFRSEMIQVNRQVGFSNFSEYQNRKDCLFEHRACYNAELIRMALNAPLNLENVTSLETRLSPMDTVQKDLDRIMNVDRLRLYANRRGSDAYNGSPSDIDVVRNSKNDMTLFFLFHFIKRKDDVSLQCDELMHICRHYNLRRKIRSQALVLAKSLSVSNYLSNRVRGIDCAANEIGCPPEVFATAFRFLRNYREDEFENKTNLFTVRRRPLSVTYHVGEDFLDIASALRAIDEAISFLELQRGDRIGHALGLGVLPRIHYDLKGKRVYLRKQDRLDDLVWVLYRGRELGVRINPHLYGLLKKEAESLFTEIYQSIISELRCSISLTDYHCIMQLHGDDPIRYRTGKYKEPAGLISQYEEHQVSYRNNSLNNYRRNDIFAHIYYSYHYDTNVKIRGYEVCSVDIDDDYMDLMSEIQDRLQEELSKKGIIVESNPSSNVLIGTFQNYSNHPIFRFNHSGLSADSTNKSSANQLQVCVNTDDLGVFDTSLEFEYALLFQTLEEEKNADGSKRFSTSDILQYLEHLRVMGHWAVFPACQEIAANR